MSFDFSTLITDRTSSDLQSLRELLGKPVSEWTEAEKAEFNLARSKGSYNYTDLNRVTACMDYLNEVLTGLGYETGYQRIAVPHQDAGGRLPSGYTELQYIESTGTQYINTGFQPNQNTRVTATAYLTPSDAGTWLFGARNAVLNSTFGFLSYENAYRSDYNTDQNKSIPAAYSDPFEIDKNKNQTQINGETEATSSMGTFQCNYPLILFANNTGGSISGRGSGKIYQLSIYDNGTMVRMFIPCINPDGEIGLYDAANGQFYGNSGTGVFIGGPEIVTLPSGYKQLEYIQSTGEQYVDSGFIPDSNTTVEVGYYSTATQGAIIGSDNSWLNNDFVIELHFAAFSSVSYHHPTVPIGRHTAILDKGVFIFDGVPLTTMMGTFNGSYSLTLFALNRSDVVQEYGALCLYECKIYDNGILVQMFIPCQNPDDEIGLYDIVTGHFYKNDGAGLFNAGPEITQDPKKELDPYIWYESDTPTVSLMDEYLANVAALRAVLDLPETTPEVPADMDRLTQAEANTIERILGLIQSYLSALQQIFLRCGATTCGGPGFYFVN